MYFWRKTMIRMAGTAPKPTTIRHMWFSLQFMDWNRKYTGISRAKVEATATYHMGCHKETVPPFFFWEAYSAKKLNATGKSTPMPTPMMNRAMMRVQTSGATAQAMAATTKNTMSAMKTLKRPSLSTKYPPKTDPTQRADHDRSGDDREHGGRQVEVFGDVGHPERHGGEVIGVQEDAA